MKIGEVFCEIWRGPFLESVHTGHAVICDDQGTILRTWGDPDQVILPRSSCKMIQALPLVLSGAADAFHLGPDRLALACASHNGAGIHTTRVLEWLGDLGYRDEDLICGPQEPRETGDQIALIKDDASPCRYHNNCSGKHTGFLTYCKSTGASLDYVSLDHPLQKDVREMFEMTTGETSPGHGVDGCSAPNFATSVAGLARAMGWFAGAHGRSDSAASAAVRLREAMMQFPELVAGEPRACTELMRAMDHKVAVKTGAEGVFVAIIPEHKLGVALKISDGTTRAAECAMAAILVSLGCLDANHPIAQKYTNGVIRNWDGLETGKMSSGASIKFEAI